MTLTIGGYIPVNVAKAFNILKLMKEHANGTN